MNLEGGAEAWCDFRLPAFLSSHREQFDGAKLFHVP
jgi:hypothetical protein